MDPDKRPFFSKVRARSRMITALSLTAVIVYFLMAGVFSDIASAKDRSFSLTKLKKLFSRDKEKVSAPLPAKKSIVITLENAIDIALDKNYLFKSKKAQVEEKKAILMRKRSAYLPKVSLDSYYRRWDDHSFNFFSDERAGTGLGPYDTFDYSVNLSHNIYDGGKKEAELKKAQAELESAENEYEIEKLNLLYEVKKVYYDALKHANELNLKRGLLEEKTSDVEVSGNLFKNGMILKRDMLKANVALAQARYSLKKAENDYGIVLMKLKSELGFDLSADIELSNSAVPRNLDIDLDYMLSKALSEGPMAKKLRADVMAAEKDIDKAEAGFMRPKLSLESEYGYINKHAAPENSYWKVEFQVSFPLFDGGEALAEIKEAKAILEQAEAEEKDLRNCLEIDVRSAYARIQELKELLPVMEESVNQAQENLKVENDVYEEGYAISLEVLKAQNLLASVKADYLTAIYDYNLAVAALECAAGEECNQGYDIDYDNLLETEEEAEAYRSVGHLSQLQ